MLSQTKSNELDPLRSFPWKVQEENSCATGLIDIEWLSCQPMLPFLVPMISTQLLYRSLLAHGMEESLDVIEWIRGKQLQKILDFDIWEKSEELSSDDISVKQVLGWIRIWLDIAPDFAAERFFELEEETIVLTLSKLFEIMPVGLNNTIDDMCDDWQQTPDKRFYIKMNFNELDDDFYLLKSFVASLYGTDPSYAGSTLSYASMLIRQESLETGLRWRSGRLADQGFVSKEDALQTLSPKKLGDLKKIGLNVKFRQHMDQDEELEAIAAFLSKMSPEDGIHYMQLALSTETIKQIAGNSDTAVEQFYQDEDFLLSATEQIAGKAKELLLKMQSQQAQQNSNRLLIEKIFSFISKNNIEKSSLLKERLAHLSNTIVSVATNSFDNDVINRSLAVTRGILNIGLEICLAIPSEFGLDLDKTKNDMENGAVFVETVGPEFIFQLGWNSLLNLKNQIPKGIDMEYGKLSNELHVTLTALKNFIPMYPKTLDVRSEHVPTYVTQEVRPFETLSDIENAKLFIKSMEI
jgi:hypothetical protein